MALFTLFSVLTWEALLTTSTEEAAFTLIALLSLRSLDTHSNWTLFSEVALLSFFTRKAEWTTFTFWSWRALWPNCAKIEYTIISECED